MAAEFFELQKPENVASATMDVGYKLIFISFSRYVLVLHIPTLKLPCILVYFYTIHKHSKHRMEFGGEV